MAQVKLDQITKRYDDVVAVNNMDCTVRDGEFLTLVGPSGCGKSTTLSSIAGLISPTTGKIFIGDRDVTNLPPKDRNIAMVFQNIALFPHMDVRSNISFGLRLRDHKQDEIEKRVKEAAKTVQIDGMLDRMPDELSGGQRQRVAIARSIVRDPDVFLMDEPLANLDAKLRTHMRTELQRLHKEFGKTTIYVTHDQEEAMTMSDRIAIINEGKLQQISPPLTCYNEPSNRFVASFIGSPSINFIDGELREDEISTDYFDVSFDPTTIDQDVGSDVVLGIRPEDIYIGDEMEVSSETTNKVEVVTDVLQPMGNEIYVYFFFPDDKSYMDDMDSSKQRIMRTDSDTDIEEDEHVEIIIDRRNIHLFDKSSGEAICHGLSTPTETASANNID